MATGMLTVGILVAAAPLAKPDADMQKVLDALAGLHPKPIATPFPP